MKQKQSHNKNVKPPFISRFIMKKLYPDYGDYTTIGDMEEYFHLIAEKEGKRKAKNYYRREVIRSLLPFYFQSLSFGVSMFKNVIKMALRILVKNKTHSAINLIGLTLGITSLIIISLYIFDELSFDKFHKNYDKIGRLVTLDKASSHGERYYALVSNLLGEMLEKEYPEIEEYTKFIDGSGFGRFTVQYKDVRFQEDTYVLAKPSFFKVFDFAKPEGCEPDVLEDLNNVILTKSYAKRIFGDEDPIGKTLTTDRPWGDLLVKGVMEDPPANSHIQFNLMISFDVIKSNRFIRERMLGSLDRSFLRTYILFRDEAAMGSFQEKLVEFEQRHKTEVFGTQENLLLQPMADIHFGSGNYEFPHNYGGKSKTTIYILGIIGFFIILIACINYSNLSNAIYLARAKEIGMRKVVGASKKQLLYQIFTESMVMTGSAILVSFLLVYLLLPDFNAYYEKELSLNLFDNFFIILFSLFLTLVFGMVSGSLPALYLSKMKTVSLMKFKNENQGSGSVVKKSLVVLQFAISVMLIFATITVNNQLHFVKNKELGFKQDEKIIIDINSRSARTNYQAMMTEFASHPDVKNVSVSTNIPCDWKNIPSFEMRNFGEDESANRRMSFIGADKAFWDIYQVELVAGTNFRGNNSDTSLVMLNEMAVKRLGLKDPVGKQIILDTGRQNQNFTIIGVLKDFHFRSLHQPIEPFVLGYKFNPFESIDYFTAEVSANNISATLKHLQSVHEKFDKSTQFEFNFLDERIKDFYEQDEREGVIVNTASSMSILIACLGLFGLAAFTARQKLKEIGVRKILGASLIQVAYSFSKEFMTIICLAFLIGLPLAYYFMNQWLEGFAYRINIGFIETSVSLLSVILIATIAISYQVIKVSRTNPVDVIRNE